MLERDRLVTLGFALATFLVGALSWVLPVWLVGIGALALAVAQFVRVRLSDDWAIVETTLGIWLLLLAGTTVWTPAWGIPLLFITGGVQIAQALDDLGMAINLALVAGVAYWADAPLWAVAVVALVAVGKVLFIVRDALEYDSPGRSLST
jgi:hypothetical protein